MFVFCFYAAQAHASVDLSGNSVKFLYHFNLPSSSTDSSGNSYDLTTQGWSSTTSTVLTNLNNAVYSTSFTDTYTNSLTPVNILTADVTVGAWYNASTTGTDQRIVSFASLDNVVLYHNFDGTNDTPKCQFIDTNQGHVWSITGSSISGGKHFVVCTWNHSTGDGLLYEDGTLNQTVNHGSNGAIKAGDSRLYIGKGIGSDSPAKGSIDEVFLAGSVLPSSTISSLWNAGSGDEICVTSGCNGVSVSIATGTLQQYKSDATSTIGEGSSTMESTVTFGATLNNNGTSTVQLQVELLPANDSTFSGVANILSAAVTSGTVTVSSVSLADGLYHWRARAATSSLSSDWQTLSNPAASYDFVVHNLTSPTFALPSSSVKFLYHFDSRASSTDSSNGDYDITTQGWSGTSSVMSNLHDSAYSTSFTDTYTTSLTPASIFSGDVSVGAWYNASSSGDQRIVSFASITSCSITISTARTIRPSANSSIRTKLMYGA